MMSQQNFWNYSTKLHSLNGTILIFCEFFIDYAFGRCVSPYDAYEGDFYTYGDFDPEVAEFLEDQVTRLYESGYSWTDDYTQCVLQTSLAAIRDK